jgi:hypothetical protein
VEDLATLEKLKESNSVVVIGVFKVRPLKILGDLYRILFTVNCFTGITKPHEIKTTVDETD